MYTHTHTHTHCSEPCNEGTQSCSGGTCNCNDGYTGLDCCQCDGEYYRIGSECFGKHKCLNYIFQSSTLNCPLYSHNLLLCMQVHVPLVWNFVLMETALVMMAILAETVVCVTLATTEMESSV